MVGAALLCGSGPPDFNTADATSGPRAQPSQLATIAVIELLPRLIGPGDCGGRDRRFRPNMLRRFLKTAVSRSNLRWSCVARWRNHLLAGFADAASAHLAPGAALRGIETYGCTHCRGRNGVIDAKLSEHGRATPSMSVRWYSLATVTPSSLMKMLRVAS